MLKSPFKEPSTLEDFKDVNFFMHQLLGYKNQKGDDNLIKKLALSSKEVQELQEAMEDGPIKAWVIFKEIPCIKSRILAMAGIN